MTDDPSFYYGAVAGGLVGGFLAKIVDKTQDRLAERVVDTLLPAKAGDDASLGRLIVEWKRGRIVRVLLEAEKRVRERGVKPRPVKWDFLVPLLEAAGYVEDADLVAMFAELLASAIESDDHQHPRWRVILSQLSGDDARAFHRACAWADEVGVPHMPPDAMPGWALSRETSDLSFARLLSLDLIAVRATGSPWSGYDPTRTHEVTIPAHVAALPSQVGAQFRRAVLPPHA